MDSQSVKTTEAGGPRGYDAGKKIEGRKRQVAVDTDGRGLQLQVHEASVQDCNGAPSVLRATLARFASVKRAFADSAYAYQRVADATAIVLEIGRRLPDQVGFQCCRAAGWSGGSSPGSIATAGWRRISRQPSPRPLASSMPPVSCG